MRCCVTVWPPQRRPRPEPSVGRRAAVLIAILASALGCVTRGTFDRVREDRDALAGAKTQLEERVKLLEASNTSLDAERLSLIDRTEDLREERAVLTRDVRELREARRSLSETLKAREQELSTLSELTGTYQVLVADLESEVASGQIEIEQLREGLRLNVSDEILFDSGSAELGAEGEALLEKVARQIAAFEHRVEVQGHTDNLRISRGLAKRYPTNWELAAARAARVVRALQRFGVKGRRLTAVSFGPYQPVVPNTSPRNRGLNRRIEIRLLPPRGGETQTETRTGAKPVPPTAAPDTTSKTPPR